MEVKKKTMDLLSDGENNLVQLQVGPEERTVVDGQLPLPGCDSLLLLCGPRWGWRPA